MQSPSKSNGRFREYAHITANIFRKSLFFSLKINDICNLLIKIIATISAANRKVVQLMSKFEQVSNLGNTSR